MDREVCCLLCTDLEEQMDYNKVDLYDLDKPPVYIAGFNEDLICSKCNEGIEPGSYYVFCEDSEELIEKIGEHIGEIISNNIEFCSSCEGSEVEHRNYVFEKEFGISESTGTDVYDFISEFNIYDEKLREAVRRNLICQNCGHGVPDRDGVDTYFDFSEKIYSQTEIDEFWGVDIDLKELNFIGEIYGINFTKDELTEFVNYLYMNPSLAFKNSTGQKLYDLLAKHFPENDYRLTSEQILYRGRKRYIDQSKMRDNDLWTPPSGIASHGRYNSIGLSVLYCLDNPDGLPYELNPLKNECIDFGEFKVKKELNILDISSLFPEEFGEYISATNIDSKLLKKTYLLTNFISNCCKEIGYDGIRYKGVSNKADYYNFAIFDVEPNRNLSIIDVKSIGTEVTYRTFSNIFGG